jgi:hypothetical protein
MHRIYIIVLSRMGVGVTNNNGFWIRLLDLLALLYNYSQLEQLTRLSDESRTGLNLSLISRCCECTNQLPFITTTRNMSPSRTVTCPLLFCVILSYETSRAQQVATWQRTIRCNGNVIF